MVYRYGLHFSKAHTVRRVATISGSNICVIIMARFITSDTFRTSMRDVNHEKIPSHPVALNIFRRRCMQMFAKSEQIIQVWRLIPADFNSLKFCLNTLSWPPWPWFKGMGEFKNMGECLRGKYNFLPSFNLLLIWIFFTPMVYLAKTRKLSRNYQRIKL